MRRNVRNVRVLDLEEEKHLHTHTLWEVFSKYKVFANLCQPHQPSGPPLPPVPARPKLLRQQLLSVTNERRLLQINPNPDPQHRNAARPRLHLPILHQALKIPRPAHPDPPHPHPPPSRPALRVLLQPRPRHHRRPIPSRSGCADDWRLHTRL
jgi:hypothetical protein